MGFSFDKLGFLSGGKKMDDTTSSTKEEVVSNKTKKKKSTITNIINKATTYNSTNSVSYEVPENAVNATLGGDIGQAISELRGFFSMPDFLKKDKDNGTEVSKNILKEGKDTNEKLDDIAENTNPNKKKRGRGKDKKPRKKRGESVKDTNESLKKTNRLLVRISKNSGSSGGGGGFKLPKGLSGLGKGFIARKFFKGLGGLGAMIGAITGLQDYKKIFGLSKTTLSQKITAGIGGILMGISDTVEFFTGGKVKLLDKEFTYKKLEQIRKLAIGTLNDLIADHPQLKGFLEGTAQRVNSAIDTVGDIMGELYDSLTTNTISMPTLDKVMTKIDNASSKVWNAMTNFIDDVADGISRTGQKIPLIGDLFKDKNQKALDKATEKRQDIEDEIAEGKGWRESYSDYTKRIKKLNEELIKAKEEEVQMARENLHNNYKEKAQAILLESQSERVQKDIKAMEQWNTKSKKVESMIENDYKIMRDITKQLETATDPKEIKMLQIRLNAYGLSVKGLTERLENMKKNKPKRSSPMDVSLQSFAGTKGEDKLLQVIRRGEGTTKAQARKHGYKSGYDVTLGNGKFADDKSKTITQMSIKEVYALQKKMKKNKKNRFSTGRRDKHGKMIKLPSSAVGAYQVIEPTLRRLVKKLGIDENAKFDKATQDRIGLELLREAGGDKYRKGKITSRQYQNRIASTWASVATTKGKSKYGQHTGTSTSRIQGAIKAYKNDTEKPQKAKEKIITKSDGNRDLLEKLVKNTTPQKAEPKKRDIVLNHHIPDSRV